MSELSDNKVVCGKNDGMPFIYAKRPIDATTGDCPTGYAKCSQATSPENTICYDVDQGPEKTCGITDLQFIENKDRGAWTAKQYSITAFNSTSDIVFSKKHGDNLPITQTKLEYKPCMSPKDNSISPSQASVVYPAEYTDSCVYEPNTKKVNDPRYAQNGLKTNQYELRYNSHVYEDEQRYLPNYYRYGPRRSELEELKVYGWNRPTMSWKLSCELEGRSREEAVRAAQTDISPYEKHTAFKAMGIAMVVLFCVIIAAHIVYIISPVLHCVAIVVVIIIAPILIVRLSKEQKRLQENMEKLPEFDALNDCADSLTNVDSDYIQAQLDRAMRASESIAIWQLILWVFLGLEIGGWLCASLISS